MITPISGLPGPASTITNEDNQALDIKYDKLPGLMTMDQEKYSKLAHKN